MNHPDFRVRGKIFATLQSPEKGWAMVKLTPEQQEELVAAAPKIFMPVKGGWGRGGATNIRLAAATKGFTRDALALAWRNVAPRKLLNSDPLQ
ncbi:MAG TPA: MmcQ/YjbR family DNA-binding protein [Thermoanaerobaculia bacterium]|nr:MmcQ/YjbR family DNA-binding protein [Thermoanaerobaculia bacterium]